MSMKTLRIFVVLSIILGFSTNNALAQPWRWSFDYEEELDTPCWGTVTITGHQVMLMDLRNNGYFVKTISTYSFTDSNGNLYTGHDMTNNSLLNFVYGPNLTGRFVQHILFRDIEGKLVGTLIYSGGLTINANGEVAVQHENYKFECNK
jgi:hypothetical protein